MSHGEVMRAPSPGRCHDMPPARLQEVTFADARRMDSVGDTRHGMPSESRSTMTWHADFLERIGLLFSPGLPLLAPCLNLGAPEHHFPSRPLNRRKPGLVDARG